MKKIKFNSTLSRSEFIGLLIYLPIHTIALPILLGIHEDMNPGAYTATEYNIGYIVFSFVAVFAIAKTFLRDEFDGLLDNKMLCFFTYLRGYFLNLGLSYLMIFGLLALLGDIETWANPNQETIEYLAGDDFFQVMCFAVFLAPMVEEVLFRGLVFGTLHKYNRVLAYVVSVLLFSVLHVWQYALTMDSLEVLIYALDYLPAGIVLAWCYERSGTIWLPIFYHMGTNMVALSVAMYI